MDYKGSSVYDQEAFFASYMERRNRKQSPNIAIEGPIIFELIGNSEGCTVLDLGCGDASFGRELLLEKGILSYTGLEGSIQMRAAALENVKGLNGEIVAGTMETFEYPEESFDLVTSRFAIHYVEDIQKLFEQIYKTLKQDGRFVFSVQHPLTTSSFKSKQAGEKREDWIVDDYFHEGERKEPWINQTVVKYHRTLETYFQALRSACFNILDIREGKPERENFLEEEEYQRRRRIPLVLAFSCVK